MRTKTYEFPLTKINERLALKLFERFMVINVVDECMDRCFRSECVLKLVSALLGGYDPWDFAKQASEQTEVKFVRKFSGVVWIGILRWDYSDAE